MWRAGLIRDETRPTVRFQEPVERDDQADGRQIRQEPPEPVDSRNERHWHEPQDTHAGQFSTMLSELAAFFCFSTWRYANRMSKQAKCSR